jgi:hypothetical protein
VFKKTPKQIEAIDYIGQNPQAKDICLFGGARSSKTFTAVYIVVVRACKAAGSLHIICRETFASAKNAIWLDTIPKVMSLCFPNLKYQTNNTDYIITLPNQSKIKIAGLDDAKKVERLLGLEASTLFFNECNQIPYGAIVKLKTRLAQKNSLKKICLYDLNPPKTSSWPYQLFEQKIDPQDGEALSNPEEFISFRMNPEDNLDNIDPEYLKMLSKLPEKERKRFLLGEYDASNSGAAVYAFDRDAHVTEEAIKLPGTVWSGGDYNIDHNSGVVASQHAHGLYIWDELQIAGDTFKKADELKKLAVGASVISDSTGRNRRTSGISDWQIMEQAGFKIVPFLNPSVKDKIANLNRCFTLGLIKIHPRCKKLIRCLTQTTWDKHEQLDQKTDPSLSHLTDSLAYLTFHLYPLMDYSNYKIQSARR